MTDPSNRLTDVFRAVSNHDALTFARDVTAADTLTVAVEKSFGARE